MSAKHTPGGQCEECEGFCLHTPVNVKNILQATDDHLQGLMHYGHSRDLRQAMSAVQDMLEALLLAREFISIDRNALADASSRPDGSMEQDDADAVADYDRALLQINAAIARATGSAS